LDDHRPTGRQQVAIYRYQLRSQPSRSDTYPVPPQHNRSCIKMASAQSPLAGLSPACHLLLEAKAKKGRSYGDRFTRYAHSLLICGFDQVLLSRRSLRASTSRKSGPPPCSTVKPRYAHPISPERYVNLTVTSVQSQPNSDDLAKLGEVLGLDKDQLKSSFGDHHMVHRGETWTWPPKASRPSSICGTNLKLTVVRSMMIGSRLISPL
jgi:hypothetical protein